MQLTAVTPKLKSEFPTDFLADQSNASSVHMTASHLSEPSTTDCVSSDGHWEPHRQQLTKKIKICFILEM